MFQKGTLWPDKNYQCVHPPLDSNQAAAASDDTPESTRQIKMYKPKPKPLNPPLSSSAMTFYPKFLKGRKYFSFREFLMNGDLSQA